MDTETTRLNKFLASAGICSRRKADQLILAGLVKVNGQPVLTPGFKVEAGDEVLCDHKPVKIAKDFEYIIVNKPVRMLTTLSDPQKRPVITDLLPPNFSHLRLFPVGRLDYFSEGLVLLTNDGELANHLLHPRYAHSKVYEVKYRGQVADGQIHIMRSGMTLQDGARLQPVGVKRKLADDNFTVLEMTLREGKNRQIRRMSEELGLIILSLKRISQGVLKLGKLAPAKWRKLSNAEVRLLKNSVGLK